MTNIIKILGLSQVAVIIIGILTSFVSYKLWKIKYSDVAREINYKFPAIHDFIIHYGFILLLIPFLWATIAVYVSQRSANSNQGKIILSGFFS